MVDGWQVLRDGRRSRLARAAIDVAATVGYEQMRIADIAETAGVVRRTFSRHFADKQAAFEYGYREASDALRGAIREAYEAGSSPQDRTRRCLRALAGFLAEDPVRAQALVIHSHAAGAATVAVHCETMRRLVELILDNTAGHAQRDADRRLVAETVAGGIYEVAYTRALRGELHELPGLVPEWSDVVMAPYIAMARGGAGSGRLVAGG